MTGHAKGGASRYESDNSGYDPMEETSSSDGGSPPPSYSYYDAGHVQKADLGESGRGKLQRQQSRGVEGMTLSWKQIVVTAQDTGGGPLQCLPCCRKEISVPKQILKGVSGVVHPGTLQVIMGAR